MPSKFISQDELVSVLFRSNDTSAAVIHYQPEAGNCAIINPDHIYLCDSGAQYLDGTTDTTRTLHFGTPNPKERLANTLVLKGHIALDQAIFPKGTTGFALDCLARQFLWVCCHPFFPDQRHKANQYCRKRVWTIVMVQVMASAHT